MRPASGEYALNSILQVGAWAKKPLVDRLPCLETEVSFFYGTRDWMSPESAFLLIDNKEIKG